MSPSRDDDIVVSLDLNSPEFQAELFRLGKREQTSLLGSLEKLHRMTWGQVHRDAGLRWEKVVSRPGPGGGALYTFRLGRAFRAVACRQGAFLRILSLHPDHDSAYL